MQLIPRENKEMEEFFRRHLPKDYHSRKYLFNTTSYKQQTNDGVYTTYNINFNSKVSK